MNVFECTATSVFNDFFFIGNYEEEDEAYDDNDDPTLIWRLESQDVPDWSYVMGRIKYLRGNPDGILDEKLDIISAFISILYGLRLLEGMKL